MTDSFFHAHACQYSGHGSRLPFYDHGPPRPIVLRRSRHVSKQQKVATAVQNVELVSGWKALCARSTVVYVISVSHSELSFLGMLCRALIMKPSTVYGALPLNPKPNWLEIEKKRICTSPHKSDMRPEATGNCFCEQVRKPQTNLTQQPAALTRSTPCADPACNCLKFNLKLKTPKPRTKKTLLPP